MLKALWNRLVGRPDADAIERESERERMSAAERHFAAESVEDIQADSVTQERLGGIDPGRLLEDDERPRD